MRSMDIPTLTWLNFKSYPQGNGGRKGVSGHGPEHAQALADNRKFEADALAKFKEGDELSA
jgi:hypothetical protein